ncbi:MAG: PAS domain S-box protein [Calditrichaeota bacterium]|nr:MAG: PAS domain S-box protein [Calditrichota bacterium]MBL1203974.1 PAS domain S-box protein [Calditrichota bacterium]NOG43805.1 PAS domain S-box protein [Calditrichota bacterium]
MSLKQESTDLIKFVKHPVCVISASGLIEFINPPFITLLGFSEEKLVGQHVRILFNNEIPKNLKTKILSKTEDNKSWCGDVLINNENGELLRLQLNIVPQQSQSKEKRYICTLEKNTPTNELHEKINELKVIFRSLFQKTSDILLLFYYDQNGLPKPFMDINNITCNLLGYARKDLLEFSLLDIVDNTSRNDVLGLQEILNTKAVNYMTLDLQKKNGGTVNIEVEAQYVNYEGRQAVLMIGKNISEQKELENKLSQIEKLEAVGQLAGGIAHDFNNVLAGISGLSELALRKLASDHKAASFIKTIHQKANNTANMVRQLVAFSRKQKLSTRTTDLNKIVKNNYKLLERYLGEDVSFITDLQPSLSMISADQASLDQIITNLCINARDAMPDGGELIITTRNKNFSQEKITTTGIIPPGKYILFSVKDTGLGMPAETIKHIFEPFFTTKDIGYGTGLGLSIVYGLIKQHNGFIECSSSIGEGTTFDMYFPWHSEKKSNKVAKAEKKNLSGKETILVAEDEADLILYLKESLEYYGYKVLIAHNGVKALELFEDNIEQIDMIISDVVMPEMGGVELKLVTQNIKKDIKFLLISAYTNRIEPGIAFLPKPFQMEELAMMVRSILDNTFIYE